MKLSYVQAHLDWSDAFVRHVIQPCEDTRQNVGLPLDRSARLEVAARRSLLARATLRLAFGRAWLSLHAEPAGREPIRAHMAHVRQRENERIAADWVR